MPGLALPVKAVRTWQQAGSNKASPNASPKVALPVSPARNLPGTLLPLTGQGASVTDCGKSAGKAGTARRALDLKALIPEHQDAEISQRYDFGDQELGFGGYGRVYLASDRTVNGREVAVKKVIMFDSEMREDFQREVCIMKELDHPNVCKVFESYDQGRAVFLVMELCEGGELFERILEHEVIAERLAADIIQQVARALKHAHDKGIAHRDLKPENVCFCSKDVKNSHVKVIDWGLGFYFRRARMNAAVGSAAYAAPEVQQAGPKGAYTVACDLWGLGALACAMLTGHPPLFKKGKSSSRVSTADTGSMSPMQADSPLQGPIWDSISPAAKDLVESLLRTEPGQRPSLETVLEHPWLKIKEMDMDTKVAKQILVNMRNFNNTSAFLSLCAASVARQLSDCGMEDLVQVFQELDTNDDGVLQLQEVRDGFARILGTGSTQMEEIDELFARLDIDGSGAIDYTEFCAAGLGGRMSNEVEASWAAFKAFDVYDSDGCISEEEIVQVLTDAGVGGVWPESTCKRLAREAVARFDSDGNGVLDFDEWMQMMRQICSE